MSALQMAASHCPVIGKALAIQQSKREYVTKSEKASMTPTHPGFAASVSLEEVHRAAGVTDLTKGKLILLSKTDYEGLVLMLRLRGGLMD